MLAAQIVLSLSMLFILSSVPNLSRATTFLPMYQGVPAKDCPKNVGWKPTSAELESFIEFHSQFRGDDNFTQGQTLCNALLTGQSFENMNLNGADFRGAILAFADFSGATVQDTHFDGADLTKAKFNSASLIRVNFRNALLYGSRFNSSKIQIADFSKANLHTVDFTGADLISVRLDQTVMTNAILTHANFQPVSPPQVGSVGGIVGLSELKLVRAAQSQGELYAGLTLLRKALKDSGLRTSERELTYTIEKIRNRDLSPAEAYVRTLLFDWTGAYGMYPLRPLIFLAFLILPMWGVYFVTFYLAPQDKIVRVYLQGSLLTNEEVVVAHKTIVVPVSTKLMKRLRVSLWFSILSAFHYGWRDLSVGSWLEKLQNSGYSLKPIGWVRTVSGFQSLVSLYLLGLSLILYFGRPFG